MIKNKKTKKILSRALAILGVVVILVSVFAIPASAWEVTDIHFYNYADLSAFPTPTKNDGRQAYISAVNPEEGTLTIKIPFSVADYYYVPYQYTNMTLRDLLPDVKVGETYVLSGEYFEETESNSSTFSHYLSLFSSKWTGSRKWEFGSALSITEDYLDAFVVPWGANFQGGTALPEKGETLTRTLRLWVNKDEAQDFVPHDILGDLTKTEVENAYNDGYAEGKTDGYDMGYDEGYDNGYDSGNKDYISDNLLVSSKTMSFRRIYRDANGDYPVYGSIFRTSELEGYYPFNGYSFRTSLISADLFGEECAGATPIGYEITCITKQLGEYFAVSDSPLTLSGDEIRVTIRVRTTTSAVNEYIEKEYTLTKNNIVTVDWEADFGLAPSDKIQSIMFIARYVLPLLPGSEFTEFAFAFANTDAHSFQVGLEEGIAMGKDEGHAQGYEEGRADGFEAGHTLGAISGKEVGIEEGKLLGYNEGYTKGKEAGVTIGKEQGYYEGVADEQGKSSFFSLIYSVVDAPVQVITQTLDFNIMGVNMGSLFFSLVTFLVMVSVVVLVVKLFI